VSNQNERRLGSSGVFQAIVMSARRLKRALSESDVDLPPEAEAIATSIAQAFVAGRFADVHALGALELQQRTARDTFVERWRAAVVERGTLTGFEVSSAGQIELQYIPGLEEVPQARFAAFVEIVFGTPEVPLDHDKAFAVGVVLLQDDGAPRIGAIHAR
jgi:hypothetical protein